MYRLALPLVLAVAAWGCKASVNGNGQDGSTLDGLQTDLATVDGLPPGVDALPPDSGPPPPLKLPTFVNLDWNAFPRDPGPSYQPSGRVWVVKKSGSDSGQGTDSSPLQTITKALGKARSGDMIRVHAGTYAEGLPDDFRALVIDTNDIVLTAAPGEKVVVEPKDGDYEYGVSITGDDVVVNGINLTGFTYSMQVGRDDRAQKNVVISNLSLEAPSSGFNEGIIAYEDTSSSGFPTMDGLLIKNVSMRNMSMGVSCNDGPCKSWRLENVKIVGQGGSGSGADAIAVERGDNFLFYRVDVSRVAADGIDTKATRVVVWDCHVHDLARNGVKLWRGGDVVNTRIHHTGADAAVVTEQGPRIRLLHSVVAYHNEGGSGYGLTFGYDSQAAQKVEIINSIIVGNSGGAYVNDASTLEVKNSLFYDIANDEVLSKGGTTIELTDGPMEIQNAGFGSGNIFEAPDLTAEMRLNPGSPAVNRGWPLSTDYPEKDCEGKPRVKSGAADLGAFEDH